MTHEEIPHTDGPQGRSKGKVGRERRGEMFTQSTLSSKSKQRRRSQGEEKM